MKLRLPLALLLGLSLACGSEDEVAPIEEPTQNSTPPPPPPPPPVDNAEGNNAEGNNAEGNNAEGNDAEGNDAEGGDGSTEEIEGTEPTEEEADETEYEGKNFTVNFTTDSRRELHDTAQRRLNSASNAAGYGEVRKVKMSKVNCGDDGCSAQASGRGYRKVEKEADAAEDAQ